MEDDAALIIALTMMFAVIPLSGGLALWLILRARRKSDAPPSREMDGTVTFPVRGLLRGGRFLGYSKNNLSARFAVAPDGLRFKIFRFDHWPFAEIAQVDAPWNPFSTRIAFHARSGATLFVDVAGEARGRELLRLLPAGLVLTPRALALRDSGP
ncbi:hypothetical protein [Roseomonas sp. BN140053]|uniref:hypothetical protein n=1 Tax=Roseomonas sp. BN140053 TaxID=3391898 RepID=UPI0039E97F7B